MLYVLMIGIVSFELWFGVVVTLVWIAAFVFINIKLDCVDCV